MSSISQMKRIKRNEDKRSISEEERNILRFMEAFSLLLTPLSLFHGLAT